ncbi:hypothetical protein CsatB_000255 [Cannabis sativa]
MGNYKFRLSDMIPNAWFYKLKDINNKPRNQNQNQKKKPPPPSPSPPSSSSSSSSTTTNKLSFSINQKHNNKKKKKNKPNQQQQQYQYCPSRKSYYFTRDLNNEEEEKSSYSSSPRKTSKHRINRRRKPTTTKSSSSPSPSPNNFTNSSVSSSGLSCKAKIESVFAKPKQILDDPEFRCDRILTTFDENDVVIDVDKASLCYLGHNNNNNNDEHQVFDSFPELELPPIITKSKKKQHRNSNSSYSPGVKLRIHSPRIVGKRISGGGGGGRKSVSNEERMKMMKKKRSLSESFAIVKSSFDPQKDFRESMVEMIVENNIRASKDLEDLLACYLSLNSDEYHDVIIKVFKQIWFELTDLSSSFK